MCKRKGRNDLESAMETANDMMLGREVAEIFYSIIKEKALTPKQIEELTERLKKSAVPLAAMRRSPEGKFRVISFDKLTGDVKLEGEFGDRKVAIGVAREMTLRKREEHPEVSYDHATIYCAYDSEGTYRGGDIWMED